MDKLQAIADRLDIEALRSEFTDAVMVHDHDRFASLFSESGIWKIPVVDVELVGGADGVLRIRQAELPLAPSSRCDGPSDRPRAAGAHSVHCHSRRRPDHRLGRQCGPGVHGRRPTKGNGFVMPPLAQRGAHRTCCRAMALSHDSAAGALGRTRWRLGA
jgi:hypothetical protein